MGRAQQRAPVVEWARSAFPKLDVVPSAPLDTTRLKTRQGDRGRDHELARSPRAPVNASRDPFAGSASNHFERDVQVAACRMRIRADLLMRFLDECGELGLREALVLDAHLHLETKPPPLRGPIVTAQVILAFEASRFLCFATKSSDPPKQAA